MRVLVVEDDPDLRGFVSGALTAAGHAVVSVETGCIGLERALGERFDAAVIDRQLPGMEGLEIVAKMRAMGNLTPVLILSAKSLIADRVEGLRAGADDYLAKPFATAELTARIEALRRRPPLRGVSAELTVGDITLDLERQVARRGGLAIALQGREFQLLLELMRHAGEVLTRKMLLERVWGFDFDPKTNIVDTFISRLRHKLDERSDQTAIETVRGVGYRFTLV